MRFSIEFDLGPKVAPARRANHKLGMAILRWILYFLAFWGIVTYILALIIKKPNWLVFVKDIQWSNGIFLLFLVLLVVTHLEYFRVIVSDIVDKKISEFTATDYFDKLISKIQDRLMENREFVNQIREKLYPEQPSQTISDTDEISLTDANETNIVRKE